MYPNLRKYLIFVLNSFSQSRGSTPAENGATGICTARATKSPAFFSFFSPPQIDVTSFVKNCHTDTCNCNLGGDCECLCTSIAAYAHKCCQQGAAIHWRSPSLCGMYLGWPALQVIFEASLAFCCLVIQIRQKQVDNECTPSLFSCCLCVSC